MSERIKDLVQEAARYIENGHPWTDVMDDTDISEALVEFAEILKDFYYE